MDILKFCKSDFKKKWISLVFSPFRILPRCPNGTGREILPPVRNYWLRPSFSAP
ncbi:MAG: hypothetical protein Q4D38_02960 [Planctomycetia bacterium]|nr:hypothetical protein [Planctomycetia bacterium]